VGGKLKMKLSILILVAWCVFGAAFRSLPPSTILTTPSADGDFFIPVSGAYAISSGLRIHQDFSSPLGLAYYLPYVASIKLFGPDASTVHRANSIIFVAISILSFVALRRHGPFVTCIGVAFLSLLATDPCFFSDSPFLIYEGIGYNLVGLALAYICVMTAAFPKANWKSRFIDWDALLIAFCMTWATFTKINFLPVIGNLVLIAVFIRKSLSGKSVSWFICSTAFFTVLFCGLFIQVFNVDVIGMIRDAANSAHVRSDFVLFSLPETDSAGNVNYGWSAVYVRALNVVLLHQTELLCAGLLLCAIAATSELLAITGLFFAIFAVDLSQCMFNSYQSALPMLPMMFLIGLCTIKTDLCFTSTANIRKASTFVCALALVLYTGNLAVRHASAFYLDCQKPSGESIKANGWSGLRFAPPRNGSPPREYVINQGLTLIRSNGLERARIVTLDHVNPFPFLLRAPYPKGQPVWMHAWGTFDQNHHPSAETVFGNCYAVMIPKQPINQSGVTMMGSLWGDYIKTNFVFTGENDCWILLKRTRPMTDDATNVDLSHLASKTNKPKE
jgi:hypothetical protein